MQTAPRTRSCFAGMLIAATGATAQVRDLHDDVAKLDIRERTKHYAIAGTVSDGRLAEYGRALEYIYAEYAKGFGELLAETDPSKSPGPATNDRSEEPGGRFRVVVLEKEPQYQEFTRAYFPGQAEHTRGLFVPAVQLLVILHDPVAEETYEVLFHEAFHQFVDRHMPLAPVWVNEGLATYYGTARATRQGLVFDRPRTHDFDVIDAAVDARQLIPLDELMATTAAAFHGRKRIPGLPFDRTTLAYAQSYTLIFFLLRNQQNRDHLREYLRTLARAETASDVRQATARAFPAATLDALVDGWLGTVRRY